MVRHPFASFGPLVEAGMLGRSRTRPLGTAWPCSLFVAPNYYHLTSLKDPSRIRIVDGHQSCDGGELF